MPQTAENLLYVYIRGLLSNGSLSRYARILFGRVSSSFFLLQILRRCLFLQNQFNECDTYTNKMKCMARFSVSQNDCNRNQNDKSQMAAISREQWKTTNGCKTHHRQTIMDSAWFQKAENHSDTFAAILWSKNYDETMFGSGGNSPDAYGQNFQTTLKRAMGPHWVIWFRHRLRSCWWAARERERERANSNYAKREHVRVWVNVWRESRGEWTNSNEKDYVGGSHTATRFVFVFTCCWRSSSLFSFCISQTGSRRILFPHLIHSHERELSVMRMRRRCACVCCYSNFTVLNRRKQ